MTDEIHRVGGGYVNHITRRITDSGVDVRTDRTVVDELGKMVVSKVQNLDGITRTLTCPVVHI